MDELYEAYFTLLEKLGEFLDRLTELAKTKNVAAQRGDVLTVNECAKEEQSIGLTMRQLDQRREKLSFALGLQDAPLSDMPRRCPPNQRQAARAAADALLAKSKVYRSASEAARVALESSLHNVERLIEANAPGGELNPRKRGGAFTDFRT